MRLAFMGTPEFSVPVLDALVEAGHEIVAVYTQPPRPAGRGKKPRPSPVQQKAEALGLEVRTPARFRDPDAIAALEALDLDACVVVAYGLILPKAALEAARLGSYNLHASLLPRWRGAAPIQRAIMEGDAETGVAVMRMTEGLDEGPVLAEARAAIGPADTAQTLHDRLATLGAPLMVRALAEIAAGRAEPRPQPEEGVLYAAKIDKAEARIDWRLPAAVLDRRIRGLSPFPGAWFELPGDSGGESERIKVLLCSVEPAPDGADAAEPGQVLDNALLVRCGDSAEALRLKVVQRAGRGPVPSDAFLRGRAIAAGAHFR